MVSDTRGRKRFTSALMALTLAGTGMTVVDAVTTPALAEPCLRIGQARQDDGQGRAREQGFGAEDQDGGVLQAFGRNRGNPGGDGFGRGGLDTGFDGGFNAGSGRGGFDRDGFDRRGRGGDGDVGGAALGGDGNQDAGDAGNGDQGDDVLVDAGGQGGDGNAGLVGDAPEDNTGDRDQRSGGGSGGRDRGGRDTGSGRRGGDGNQGTGDAGNGDQGDDVLVDAGGQGNNGDAGNAGQGGDGNDDGPQDAGGDGNQDAGDAGNGDQGEAGNGDQGDAGGGQGDGGNGGQGNGGDPGCEDVGPAPSDFADVRTFPRVRQVRFGENGSRGTFISRCGTNQNGHFNSDNHIVAPGVSNGAQHQHDYVGNLTTSGQSTNESLAAGGTTCDRGDRSAYFWPVLRDRTRQGDDADAPGGGQDGNIGRILTPRSAIMEFRGNPQSKVVAAPRFLRLITGDAKSAVNGAANARAGWTCSGFTDRVSRDKYPLCPRGSLVTRVLDFPSCWDGQNLDSANHRTHVVFPDDDGACPQGTRPIPQLRMTLMYAAPQGPNFAVDAFPDQRHAPITDHADFHNVMPESLMNLVVDCINSGRRC